MLLLIFKSMKHHSDHIAQLYRTGSFTDNDIIRQEVDILNINWQAIHAVIEKTWGYKGVRCPLCFWNDHKFVYPKPKPARLETKTIYKINDSYAKCPCILYDLEIINQRDARNQLTPYAQKARDIFWYLQLDWKAWIASLQNGSTYTQPALPQANTKDTKQLAQAF